MIYLDHHATTPCDARVVAAMLPYFSERFGNPSGRTHALGKVAYEATEAARAEIAALVGGDAREITFTSGATESISLAFHGLAEAYPERPRRLVVSTFEHKAVIDTAKQLARHGFEVAWVEPSPAGFVTPDAVARALGAGGALLVAVMAAQNEIGTVQPLAEIAALARARAAFVFSDISQAVGKVPLDLPALGVELAAFTAHKLYGPKGVGALWVRRERGRDIQLTPQIEGGGQERGLRAGTLNVPGIVGFGEAARLARTLMSEEAPRLSSLRARLLSGLRAKLGAVRVTGAADDASDGPAPRLPGNLHVSFPGVEGARLLAALHDVAVSSGSACSSQKLEGSHVLRALGLPDARLFSAVRFGLGRGTSEADIDAAIARVSDEVSRLRPGAATPS